MKSFRGSPSGPVVCRVAVVNVDPANQVANSATYVNVAVPNVQPGAIASNVRQTVFVNPLTDVSTPGILLGLNPRVSAVNTVRYCQANCTAGPLDAAALDIAFVILGDPNAD